MSDFSYRDIKPNDLPRIVNMIRELAAAEGRPDAATITTTELDNLLFGNRKIAHGIIAELDGEIVGYALIALKFSSFKGYRIAYLEDVLVTKSARSRGLGRSMMRAVAQKAQELDCQALEWSALDDNLAAIGFYDHIGANRETGRVHFILGTDRIHEWAEGLNE